MATSTNALNTSINELAVSTGTLLSNTSAQDIYYPRTGGTISGPVTITSNVYTSGYKIYTNSIQFDDGTVMTSTKTLASLSDNLGNHTATQDLNMNGKNITNAGLVDGYDISGQFGEVATSTNALNTSINELALSTGAIQNDVNEVAFSTGPLRDNITALEVSTGTLLDKSSATVTYLYKNEQANDSERLGGYGYGYYATTASLYDIVQDTITLGSDLYAVKTDTGTLHDDLTTEIAARIALDFAIGNDTGTLRSDINKIIVSTGDFVKKTGDTMTGELSVSTLNVISQISFADGSIITSSSTLGDNLGNHTATQDLNMNGKNITNTGLVDGYDISAQFGDVAGSTNSLKVMVNELGLSTGALSGDMEAISMSTSTLREDITTLAMSTGTLLDKSSATLTYLFKNETASDSMKLGGYEYEYYATTASIYEIGVDTGILSNDVYALKMDTGTLRTDMDVLAFSTGTLLSTASASAIYYPISGGNINGAVTVSSNVYVNGYRLYISSIQFADGTVIDSTASLIVAGEGGAGDNLGNHIASKNINLSGYGLFNVSSITLAGSILSTGTIGDIPAQGAGTRFMWYPGKAALRAGSVTDTQWDDANVGNYSIGIGQNVIASQSGSFALGKNIFNSTPDSFAAGFGPAPGLFVAGSSVAVNSTSFPAGNSISFYTVGAMLNSGTFGSGNSISAMTGIRMLWYPKLASFRVGGTDSTQWDHSNIGQYSFAAGYNTLAKGNNSVAMGIGTEANGLSSIAFGSQSIANGNQATAMGNTSFASGQNSTAIGNSAYASGYDSAAIGSDARATGHTSLSLGQYVNAGSSNTVVIGKGAFWNDPLINNTVDTFMVGFNRNKPSFTVFQSSINVDASAGFIEDVLTVSTGNVTVARIQGDGNAFANGAWNGAGADYAEWFRKEGQIETGDIVGLNASSGRTRRYEIGDVLIGVCSERPAFVGNRDLGKTEQEMFADYALVGLVGQVDIKMDQVSVTGNKVATKDGKQIGYLMEDGKIFIRIKD
ncbi:MAG: hypothetical protein BWY26_01089 [Elusimicrobia bacterium ADurb.Bin231]|nr:MAG: hypothetical protein BWY26_01089 [Elusimicrobia bacterium ADurb.Bin231]